jgi:hypothetical protein
MPCPTCHDLHPSTLPSTASPPRDHHPAVLFVPVAALQSAAAAGGSGSCPSCVLLWEALGLYTTAEQWSAEDLAGAMVELRIELGRRMKVFWRKGVVYLELFTREVEGGGEGEGELEHIHMRLLINPGLPAHWMKQSVLVRPSGVRARSLSILPRIAALILPRPGLMTAFKIMFYAARRTPCRFLQESSTFVWTAAVIPSCGRLLEYVGYTPR